MVRLLLIRIVTLYIKIFNLKTSELNLIKGLATQPDPHKRPSRKTLKPDPIEEP